MIEHNQITERLVARPGWHNLSAYERTKIACEELIRAGAAIPAWNTIRDIIGKGSANDINRGKKDFRIEHASALRKMEGFSAEGVPPSLSPFVVGIWQEAVSHAQAVFSDKVSLWEEAVDQAEAAREHAQAELERVQAEAQALNAKIDGLEQARTALQDQVRSEQAARAQAEKMLDEIRADLVGQRDRLDEALKHAQTELDKAITRLESSERRYLMEIERARQEAAAKVAHANTLLKDSQDKHQLEVVRLSKQLQDERTQGARNRERVLVLEQENRTLSERARRAEALTDELQAQGTKLLSSIGKPGLRRSQTLKKKRIRRKSVGPAQPAKKVL